MSGRTGKIVLGVVLVALLGVGGLLLVLGQMATGKDQDLATPWKIAGAVTTTAVGDGRVVDDNPVPATVENQGSEPSASTAAAVAIRVDGVEISHAEVEWATAVDGVMNSLAGQPVPSQVETLNRYVNDVLLLKEAGLQDAEVGVDEATQRLEQLRSSMGFTQDQVAQALEAGGVTQDDLVRRLGHLMLVERAIRDLGKLHPDLDAWLSQERAGADIWVNEEYTSASSPAEVVTESPESATPATQIEVGQPAPDFSLIDAQGATISLSDFRDLSKVVLVFYPGST